MYTSLRILGDDHFIAYCKARQPQIKQRFNTGESLTDAFAQQQISIDDIQDFEVSSVSMNKKFISVRFQTELEKI